MCLASLLVLALLAGLAPIPTAYAAPGNDDFASAIDIASLFSSAYTSPSLDTTTATREAAESPSLSSCGSFPVAPTNTHSAWFRFTASANGWVTLDTRLSDYDTVLEVWTGPAPAGAAIGTLDLPSAACNDDAGKSSPQSEVTLAVTSGTHYYVMVRDFGSANVGGDLVLRGFYNATHQIYVDRLIGDDSNNTGSATLPFQTIQKGINTVTAGGAVNVAAGTYPETVTIAKALTLADWGGAGARTATMFVLNSGANVTLSGTVSAPDVTVNPGALIQQGIALASTGGRVSVAAGTYTEQLSIDKDLVLQGQDSASRAVLAPGAGNTAITISAGDVTVRYFDLQSNATGVSVSGGSVTLHRNNVSGSTVFGVNASVSVTAVENWWGASTGPAHASNPPGAGVAVSDNVSFSPWCLNALPNCPPTAGIATQLVFITQPSDTAAAASITPAPVVEARDVNNNRALSFNGPVTLTIGANPGGGTLSPLTPVVAVNGVITFTGRSINNPGVAYTLVASAPGLTSATSNAFNIYNAGPNAVDDARSTNEDTPTTFDPRVNDVDADPISIIAVGVPTTGSASFTSASVTYTPPGDFNGAAVLTYTVTDIYGIFTDTATITVTVNAVNDAPSFANAGDQLWNEDGGLRTVANWATAISPGPADEAGQTVTFTVTNDNNPLFSGQPSVNSAGTLTFTPAANAFGSATVTARVVDNGGTANGGVNQSAPQMFVITISPVNDAPSFTVGPNRTVGEDSGAQSFSNQATAISPGPVNEAGQTVTFTVTNNNTSLFSAQPAIDPAGGLTFTPATNAFGSATVTVRAVDNGGTASGGVDTSGPQTFTITVNSVNDPVAAVDDAATVNEDSGVNTVFVLVNDSASNVDAGETLTVTAAGTASNGAVGFSATQVTYTPSANYFGSDSFSYTVSDGTFSASGTVNVTVSAVNDAPAFVKGANQNVNEDAGAQTVAGWATSISPGPANESAQTVSFNAANSNAALFSAQPAIDPAGTLTFTPAPNLFGSAAVTVTVQDNGGTANGGVDTSAPQTFTITVAGVNDAPSFGSSGDVTVDEDSGAYSAGWATSVSAGPNETQTVTFTVTNDQNGLFAVQPAINSAGTLTFTPAANVHGSATVTVFATDNGGTANGGVNTSGTAQFVITINSVNDAPSFSLTPAVTVTEDAPLTIVGGVAFAITPGPANEAAQTVTFLTSNTSPAAFSVQPGLSPTGTLTFQPAPNAFGTITVTVQLQDSGGTANGGVDTSALQTFVIIITPQPDAPVALPDSITLNEDGGAQPVNARANDASPDNGSLAVTAVTPAANGTASLAASDINYAPSADFFGTDTFTYTLSDGGPLTATARVTVTVLSVNDAPSFIAGGDVTVNEDTGAYSGAWAASIAAGPVNESGQTYSFTVSNDNTALFAAQPALSPAGTLTFTPAPNAFGSATVNVTLTDNGGTANGGVDASAAQAFTLTLTPVNDPPDAVNDSVSVLVDSTANTLNVLANDTIAPDAGETLQITVVTPATNGVVSIAPGGGSLVYTPNAGYAGPDSFVYVVTDSNGAPDAATVSVNVSNSQSRVYLPLVMRNHQALPDLVGSFSLSPANPVAGQPVTITVVVTNQGSAATGAFWVDFYINPSPAPNASNQPWDQRCGITPCKGIAWYITTPMNPGQSIVLTSLPGSYYAPNTCWDSATAPVSCPSPLPVGFVSGTNALYLYVDSWNPGVASGAVLEGDEANNLFARTGLGPLGFDARGAPNSAPPAFRLDMPPRELWREEQP